MMHRQNRYGTPGLSTSSFSSWRRSHRNPRHTEGVPDATCTRPSGKQGPEVCNSSVYYTSCGMGQCDQSGCTTILTPADIVRAVALAQSVDVVVVNVAVTSTEG